MAGEAPGSLNEADQAAIRNVLDGILKSAPFRQSERRQKFLRYIAGEAMAGRGDRLKAYTIAVEVFERPETFDPVTDPIVRVEAGRLRDKLREYYEGEGKNAAVRIELPKGAYAPQFEFASVSPNPEPVGQPSPGSTPSSLPNKSLWSGSGSRQFGLLFAALAFVAAAAVWIDGYTPARTLLEKPSIAVLPFDNIGGDPNWERLATGLSEDVILDLTHSKDLAVIARNSTRVYKGKPADIRQIGRDLNVKYVLEGSIQPMGERIRITAQLIDALSGNHVWSQRYDRPSGDLFEVQNDVTQSIAATLGGYEGAVAEAERRLVRRKPPASLTAFDTYLLAMEAKHKVTKESLFEAEALFHKALELDPQLARAYVGLVDTQFYMIDLGIAPSVGTAVAKMLLFGEKAVALDPSDGKSHYALGIANIYQGNPEQALIAFSRAEALAPSDTDMLLCIAWSIPVLGQTERAVSLAERALKYNPHYPDWYNQGLSYVFFFGEQYQRSVTYRKLVKRPLALDYAFMAMAYGFLGRTDDAAAAAKNVKSMDPAWVAERYLSEGGGSSAREAELFINGARKGGLPACVPGGKLKDMPNLIRVKSCDEERAKS